MAPIKEHKRWAAWEHAVLSKADNPEKCQQVILTRQREVDDDQDESDLVAAHFRERLTACGANPQTCCVFIRASRLAEWIADVTGENVHATKVTPYLKTLGIAELRRAPRTAKAAGWIWRGPQAKKKQKVRNLDTIRMLPGTSRR